MFTGEHERLLDEKGRLSLPPVFRRQLVESAFLARSDSAPCLLMLSPVEILRVADRLKERVLNGEVSVDQQRRWGACITEVKTDSLGRLAIPPKLRQLGGLEREVVLIGVIDRAEIWDADAWAEVERATDEDVNEGMWL